MNFIDPPSSFMQGEIEEKVQQLTSHTEEAGRLEGDLAEAHNQVDELNLIMDTWRASTVRWAPI